MSAANNPLMRFHMSIIPLTINRLSTADAGTPTPSLLCSASIQGRRAIITVPLDDERWRRTRVRIARTMREHENDGDIIESGDMIYFVSGRYPRREKLPFALWASYFRLGVRESEFQGSEKPYRTLHPAIAVATTSQPEVLGSHGSEDGAKNFVRLEMAIAPLTNEDYQLMQSPEQRRRRMPALNKAVSMNDSLLMKCLCLY